MPTTNSRFSWATRMGRTKPSILLGTAAFGLLAGLAATGCTSSNASPASAPPSTANGPAATVDVAKTGLGNILVDSHGRTLYLFQKDSGTTSACTGACAAAWPPLRVTSQPTAGSGTTAALVGTTSRSDGNPQVTYNGHPLYLYVGDQKTGDTNGQGITAFGAAWYTLTPAGTQISALSATTSGNTSGSSGNGY
jgi:predicted lipoprotein with Yx(FWY)xxD motif